MKFLRRLALFFLVVYAGIAAVVFVFQERLIFHPRPIPVDYQYDWGEEITVPVEGATLSTVWTRKPNSKGVVIYLHGNVGDNNRGLYQMRNVLERPYDAVFVDYRGFGKSTGEVESDEQLLADVQAVYDRVKQTYSEDKIHLLGYSLGTGMASYLAAQNSPAELTLVAPYTNLEDMKNQAFWWLPDFLLKYRLDTESRIAKVKCPVNIFHGTKDELIPFSMAERLQQLSPKQVRLFPMEGVGHRGAILRMGTSWLD
ncbi:MAG: alpha/beta hydrolase [Saprospiraceae bacterium]